MPATSAGMAAIASSQAAIAQHAAHEAKVAMCKVTMPNFDAQKATVSEMKEYADCVETIYPTEIGADATVALKVLFVLALVGMSFGAWRERYYRLMDIIMGGVCGLIFAPAAVALIAGLVIGCVWLFS